MPFRLTVKPTETITRIDGVACRLWQGRLPSGAAVDVFVHRICTADPAAQGELERELVEMLPPKTIDPPPVLTSSNLPFDLRHIL